MTRQDKNEEFLLTSFLYGGNAAYIDDLYAPFKAEPKSVDPTWASYFGKLEDTSAEVSVNAEKALTKQAEAAGTGPVSAEDVHQATRDSIRAIMMIRAFRMRGHLH